MPHDFQQDIDAVGRITAVPSILDLVCRITGLRFAAVARVTEDRWIACQVLDQLEFGLKPGGELKVETTICNEIRQSGHHVVIDHVAEDPLFRDHHTPAMYGLQSYISVPIVRRDGSFFGTLCAIDPKPARVNTPEVVGSLKLFAELIATQLDAGERMAASEAALREEQETAELREQFIAVLGHDLRNPVAAVLSGAQLLRRQPLNARGAEVVNLMERSASRMAGLIDNVMDFARGRLGGGLTLQRDALQPLEPVLRQVVQELRAVSPERRIAERYRIERPVDCDRARIGQLVSNLISNALTHGKADGPVTVEATTDETHFTLSVANDGDPIPPAEMAALFAPFARGTVKEHQQGLGLGLYIAAEIARAHGGTLTVASTAEETRFTFKMPLA